MKISEIFKRTPEPPKTFVVDGVSIALEAKDVKWIADRVTLDACNAGRSNDDCWKQEHFKAYLKREISERKKTGCEPPVSIRPNLRSTPKRTARMSASQQQIAEHERQQSRNLPKIHDDLIKTRKQESFGRTRNSGKELLNPRTPITSGLDEAVDFIRSAVEEEKTIERTQAPGNATVYVAGQDILTRTAKPKTINPISNRVTSWDVVAERVPKGSAKAEELDNRNTHFDIEGREIDPNW